MLSSLSGCLLIDWHTLPTFPVISKPSNVQLSVVGAQLFYQRHTPGWSPPARQPASPPRAGKPPSPMATTHLFCYSNAPSRWWRHARLGISHSAGPGLSCDLRPPLLTAASRPPDLQYTEQNRGIEEHLQLVTAAHWSAHRWPPALPRSLMSQIGWMSLTCSLIQSTFISDTVDGRRTWSTDGHASARETVTKVKTPDVRTTLDQDVDLTSGVIPEVIPARIVVYYHVTWIDMDFALH